MASFLSKFARSAANMGSKLYADQSMQELRSDLLAKREETLQTNRMNLQSSQQEFQALESEKRREASAGSPQTQLATMKLEDAKSLKELRDQYSSATTDKDRKLIVQEMINMSGIPGTSNNINLTANNKDIKAQVAAGLYATEAEAWKAMKDGKNNISPAVIFKVLAEQQEFMAPDDPKWLDTKAIVKLAKKLAMGESSKPEEEEDNEEEEDKFIKGKVYFDPTSNIKKTYLGGGEWGDF